MTLNDAEAKIDKLIEESLLATSLWVVLFPIMAFIAHEMLMHGLPKLLGRRIAEHTTLKKNLDKIMINAEIGKLKPTSGSKGGFVEKAVKVKKTSKYTKNAQDHVYLTSGNILTDVLQRWYYTSVFNMSKPTNKTSLFNTIKDGIYYTLTDPIFDNSKTQTLFLDIPNNDKEISKKFKTDPDTNIKNAALRSPQEETVYKSRHKLLLDIIKKNFKKAFDNQTHNQKEYKEKDVK